MTPNRRTLLILGGGAVTRYFHLPALEWLGWLDHAAVVDPSARALNALQRQFPRLRVVECDFGEFFAKRAADYSFDAALVALPNVYHTEAVRCALEAGLHVLCEKPLALTRAACLELGELAERQNRVLVAGMVRHLLPAVAALRQALEEQFIGQLTRIDIEEGAPYGWYSDSGESVNPANGGVLADMGIHWLDLVVWLAGRLTPQRYYDDACGGVEANVEYHLITETGVPVRLILSRTHLRRNTAIWRGTRGELILEKDRHDACLWQNTAGLKGELKPEQPYADARLLPTLEAAFVEQWSRFAARIDGAGGDLVTALEASESVGLVEWAYAHRQPARRAYALGNKQQLSLPDAPVVVTGGTGFIGTNLIGRLSQMGIGAPRVPIRTFRRAHAVGRYPVSFQHVNLLDKHQVMEFVAGARFVFHLAYGQDGDDPARLTIEGTQNIVEAAIAHRVECVVILSTVYVFGQPEIETTVDETFPYLPYGGEYGTSKARMEKWVLACAQRTTDTRLVILNPSCVYGPWGKTYTQMPIAMSKRGIFGWIEGGRGAANYTYVENLIDAMLIVATSPKAHGERFIINDGTTTWRAFLEPMLGSHSTGIGSYTRSELEGLNDIPKAGLRNLAGAMAADEQVRDILKRMPLTGMGIRAAKRWAPGLLRQVKGDAAPPSLLEASTAAPLPPPVWLADLFSPAQTRYSAAKAKRVLGWVPRVDLAQGQTCTVAWLEEHGVL